MAVRRFEVDVDIDRSLVRFRAVGVWDYATAQAFRAALRETVGLIAGRPFDLLADLREASPQTRTVADELQAGLARGPALGLHNCVCLVSSALMRLQFARIAAPAGFRVTCCEEEAESRLNATTRAA